MGLWSAKKTLSSQRESRDKDKNWVEGTGLNMDRRGGSEGQGPMGIGSGAEEGQPTRQTNGVTRGGALWQDIAKGDQERGEHSREGTYMVSGLN